MKIMISLILTLSVVGLPGLKREDCRAAIDTTKSTTHKTNLYLKMALSYRGKNYDSAYFYAYKGLALAHQQDYLKGKTDLWKTVGNLKFAQSDYDSAIFYYSKGYAGAEALADSAIQGDLLNNLGTVYIYKAAFDTSLILLFRAREVREQIQDPRISSTINNIGLAYMQMDDWENALHYFKKAVALKEARDQRHSLSNTLNNIGIIYRQREKYDSAIVYYEKSLAIAEEFEDKKKQANAHNNLAILYHLIEKKGQLAEHHYLRSFELKKLISDRSGLLNGYNSYATMLMKQNKHYQALQYVEMAEDIDKELGENMFRYELFMTKQNIYSALGRYEEAMIAQDSAYTIRLNEISEEKNATIAKLEVAYETAKKDAEIEQLEMENVIQEVKIKNAKIHSLTIALCAAVILALVMFYYRLVNKKQRAENKARELQIEALKNRFMELHASPSELAINLEIEDLNHKLHNPLSKREFEVLRLSLAGKSNLQIGDELYVSISTVKFHLGNVFFKMGVSNRKEAFQYVLETH